MSIVSRSVGLDYHDKTIRVCELAEYGELIVNRNVERPGRRASLTAKSLGTSDRQGAAGSVQWLPGQSHFLLLAQVNAAKRPDVSREPTPVRYRESKIARAEFS